MASGVDSEPVEVVFRLELSVLLTADGKWLNLLASKVTSTNSVGGVKVADPVTDPV